MAPEHDAHTEAFYDHESDAPSPRRRRAAADWGVNEDIFDRMPSRRFKRSDRRAEHHAEPDPRRFERRVSGPSRPAETPEPRTRFDAAAGEASRGETSDVPAQRRRRPAESWMVTDDHVPVADGKRSIDSWLTPDTGQELTLAPGESRTVVLGSALDLAAPAGAAGAAALDDPPARRTVTITGHPDRLPAARAARPPKTVLEHIGASPDRIAGYAVLLGFVLVLIAVLTTGQ
jgi:hypothetical protein